MENVGEIRGKLNTYLTTVFIMESKWDQNPVYRKRIRER